MRRTLTVFGWVSCLLGFGACGGGFGGVEGARAELTDPTWPGLPTDGIRPATASDDLPGELSVASNGAATYSIPVAVPPGRMGMVPALALTYASSSGNGLLGVGWDLAGIPPSVVRCPASDDHNHRIEVPNAPREPGSDSFCWGGQRLVPLSTTTSADVEYRTREDVHARIIANGPRWAPTSWTIYARDGRILEFDALVQPTQWSDTDANGHERGLVPGARHTIEWSIGSERDRRANRIDYSWTTEYGRVVAREPWYEHRLSEISYAGGTRRIRLTYVPRPDVRETWMSGFMRRVSRRLVQLQIVAPDVDGGTPIDQWHYALRYDNRSATGRSRIDRVSHCERAGTCARTRFEWTNGGEHLADENTFLSVATGAAGDVNGDGRDDLLFYTRFPAFPNEWRLAVAGEDFGSGSGGVRVGRAVPFDAAPMLIDVDVDGRAEVVAVDRISGPSNDEGGTGCEPIPFIDASGRVRERPIPTRGAHLCQAYRGEPACWGATRILRAGEPVRFTMSPQTFYPRGCFAAVDGAVAAEWTVLRWSPEVEVGGVAGGLAPSQLLPSTELYDPLSAHVPALYLADYDGNGTVDSFRQDDFDIWHRRIGTAGPLPFPTDEDEAGVGIQPDPRPMPCPTGSTTLAPTAPLTTSDTDGDGRVEVLLAGEDPSPNVYVTADPLDGFLTPRSLRPTNLRTSGNNYLFLDVNGDGLEDVVDLGVHDGYRTPIVNGARGLRIRFNTGEGYGPWAEGIRRGRPYEPPVISTTCTSWEGIDERVRALDYNADGLGDFIVLGEAPAVYVSTGADFVRQNLPFAWNDDPVTTSRGDIRPAFIVLDADGNGLPDFLTSRGTSALTVLRSRTDELPDRIVGVTSQRGARDEIDYAPLAEVRIDAPDACDYPVGCVAGDMHVVSEIRRDNGLGTAPTFLAETYLYEGGWYDAYGGGFLGFRRIRRARVDETFLDERIYFEPVPEEVGEADEPGFYYRFPDAGRLQETWGAAVSEDPSGRESTTVEVNGSVSAFADRFHNGLPTGVVVFQRNLTQSDTFRYTVPGEDWFCLGPFPCRTDPTWSIRSRTSPSHPVFHEALALDRYDAHGTPGRTYTTHPDGLQRTRVRFCYAHTIPGYGECGPPGDKPRRPDDYEDNWLIALPERVSMGACAGSPGCDPSEKADRVVALSWSPQGLVLSAEREPERRVADVNHVYLRTEYRRNPYGMVDSVRETDADGRVREEFTTYDLDTVLPRSMRNAAGHLSYVGMHPALAVPLIHVDPNGITDRAYADGFGRLVELRSSEGSGMTARWELFALSIAERSGADARFVLDRLGREISSTGESLSGPVESRRVFDSFGSVIAEELPSNGHGVDAIAGWYRDATGRPWELVVQGGPGLFPESVARWHWSTPRELAASDARGGRSEAVTSRDGLLESATDWRDPGEDDVGVTYDYEPFSLLRSVTPGTAAEQVVISRDVLGRPRVIDDPDAGEHVIALNAWGEVVSETIPGVQATTFVRDEIGRVRHRTIDYYAADGSVARSEINDYFYDFGEYAVGQLAFAASTADGCTTEMLYDSAGRLRTIAQSIDSIAMRVFIAYDAVGRLDTVTYPAVRRAGGVVDRMVVRYHYDPETGRLESIQTVDGLRVLWSVEEEDGLGRPLVETTGGRSRIEREYDPVWGVLTDLRVRGGTGAAAPLLHDLHVDLATDGTPEARVEALSGREEMVVHDALDRVRRWTVAGGDLVEDRDVEYRYGATGNIERVTTVGSGVTRVEEYDYTPADRPHAVRNVTTRVGGLDSSTDVTYDDAGRATAVGGRTTTWTGFDLPRTVDDGGQVTTFAYDAFDGRAGVRRPDGRLTRYLGSLYERHDQAGATEHVMYVMGPRGPIAEVHQAEASNDFQTLYLHADHLGTPEVITDQAGTVVATQWFGPFGTRVGGVSGDQVTALGFTGHRGEEALGLIDMRGRYFDAQLRRFLTPDPFVDSPASSQGWNRYSYVRNSGLGMTDPSGFGSCVDWTPEGGGTGTTCTDHSGGAPDPAGAPDHFGDTLPSPSSSTEVAGVDAPSSSMASSEPEMSFANALNNATYENAIALLEGFRDTVLSLGGVETFLVATAVTVALSLPVANIAAGTLLVAWVGAYLYEFGGDMLDDILALGRRVASGTATADDARGLGEMLGTVLLLSRGMAIGGGIGGGLGRLGTRGTRMVPGYAAEVGASRGLGARFHPDRLIDHFTRHGGDFGARTAAEYETMADRFLTGPRAEWVLETVRPISGDVVRFDPTTNMFGVVSGGGTIRTFFRPDPAVHGYPTNLDYFRAQ